MIQKNLKIYGLYAICGSCFFLQVSTTGRVFCCALFILSWLLSGGVKEVPAILKKYPTVVIASLLFVLFVIGATYTPVSGDKIADMLKKYRILLYIPIVICLAESFPNSKKYVLNSFLAGSVVALLASYLLVWEILPCKFRYAPSFPTLLSPTPHSGFMAFLIFILLGRILRGEKNSVYGIPLVLLAFYNIFFQSVSSTGMAIFVVLMILLVLQSLSAKKIASVALILVALAFCLYKFSPKVAFEVDEITNTLRSYQIGSGTMHNNVSLRLDWWLSSYLLIKQKPLTGHGTGSFEVVHDNLVKGTNIKPTSHPHNEYLYTGVQLGIPGVILFVLLLLAPLRASFYLNDQEKHILQGIIVFFAVGNFFENWLIGSATGNFYVIVMAVFLIYQHKKVAD